MKKLILVIGFIGGLIPSQAQFLGLTSDSSLGAILGELITLNGSISSMAVTAVDNKLSNFSAESFIQQGFDLSQIAEDALWKVPGYVSQGQEITDITPMRF